MAKPITTKAHGILDYLTVATALALPRLLGWSKDATRFMTLAGLGILAFSLLTKYELGVFKVLPVKAHLALDVMSALTLLAAPTLLGEKGATATIIRGMGVMELGVVSLTETKPPFGERVRQALS